MVNTPKIKLINFTQYSFVVNSWPFVMQQPFESITHLFDAMHASKISANKFRNRNSTYEKIPMDNNTAASWTFNPCSDDDIKYVKIIALNFPYRFKFSNISEIKKGREKRHEKWNFIVYWSNLSLNVLSVEMSTNFCFRRIFRSDCY